MQSSNTSGSHAIFAAAIFLPLSGVEGKPCICIGHCHKSTREPTPERRP